MLHLRYLRLSFPSSSSGRAFSTTLPSLKPSKLSARSAAAIAASPSSLDPNIKPRRILTFNTKSGASNFKTFLPVTPSLRQLRQPISEHLHKGDPIRALTIAKSSSGGRNAHGRITVRARGGGHKRRIRLVDFVRKESGEQQVVRIEYDPGRSSHIALLKHKESEGLSYIIAPMGLREGDTVQSFREGIPESFSVDANRYSPPEVARNDGTEALSLPSLPLRDGTAGERSAFAALHGSATGAPTSPSKPSDPSAPQTVLPPSHLPGFSPLTPSVEVASPTPSAAVKLTSAQIDLGVLRSVAIRPGNCLPLRLIPPGTQIHAITLTPSGPAILARSAGSSARIVSAISPSGKHAQVKLASGEVRLIGLDCLASIGVVSNNDHQHANLGKAGRMRWLGFRPQSRGVAMNALVFVLSSSSRVDSLLILF